MQVNADAARGQPSPFDWRILLNGRLDELLYERQAFQSDLPFAELKSRAHINDAARAAGDDPAFSRRIRVGPSAMP